MHCSVFSVHFLINKMLKISSDTGKWCKGQMVALSFDKNKLSP